MLYPATDGNSFRDTQPNIRPSLENHAEEREKGLSEPEGSGLSQEKRNNQQI